MFSLIKRRVMSVQYIAEIGNNHNGDISLAKEMIDAAIASKADYIKFQIYNIDKFLNKNNPYYNDLVKEGLSFDDFRKLQSYTEEKGGRFLATPFDEDSMDLLDDMGLSVVKIASGDMNNQQLLLQAIKMKKKLIIAVGGATLDEIDAMTKLLNDNNARFSILHCIINYPARFEELNLGFIDTLKERYFCPVGFSDHSPGIEASLAAIALGATVIEKHFTTNRTLPGGDNEMSVLPGEFERLVREGNNIGIALGNGERSISEDEKRTKRMIRRKFVAKRDIFEGATISDDDLLPLRVVETEKGFDSCRYYDLIGRKTITNVKQYDLITEKLIE
jgi:sialic acid synthase SpsE